MKNELNKAFEKMEYSMMCSKQLKTMRNYQQKFSTPLKDGESSNNSIIHNSNYWLILEFLSNLQDNKFSDNDDWEVYLEELLFKGKPEVVDSSPMFSLIATERVDIYKLVIDGVDTYIDTMEYRFKAPDLEAAQALVKGTDFTKWELHQI